MGPAPGLDSGARLGPPQPRSLLPARPEPLRPGYCGARLRFSSWAAVVWGGPWRRLLALRRRWGPGEARRGTGAGGSGPGPGGSVRSGARLLPRPPASCRPLAGSCTRARTCPAPRCTSCSPGSPACCSTTRRGTPAGTCWPGRCCGYVLRGKQPALGGWIGAGGAPLPLGAVWVGFCPPACARSQRPQPPLLHPSSCSALLGERGQRVWSLPPYLV